MLSLIYNEKSLEAQRLFHGRGKSLNGFENLNIDYFPPVIFITLYKETPLEKLHLIQELLMLNKKIIFDSILLQKRYLPYAPLEVFKGSMVDELIVLEDDIKIQVNFGKNQNIGFFLDMKRGRDLVKKYCKNRKILNLFSYTCMFSLVALKNGAREVINLDMSKAALQKGRENHKLNQLSESSVKFFSHDIFKSFGLLKRYSPYDFIIIDPPSDHGAHFQVERDYPKLILRIAEWSKPDTYIMTCLNSPFHSFSFLEECVQKNAPDLVLVEKCGAPPSFGEIDQDRGLKIILWKRS